jgi:hypothetical protein
MNNNSQIKEEEIERLERSLEKDNKEQAKQEQVLSEAQGLSTQERNHLESTLEDLRYRNQEHEFLIDEIKAKGLYRPYKGRYVFVNIKTSAILELKAIVIGHPDEYRCRIKIVQAGKFKDKKFNIFDQYLILFN